MNTLIIVVARIIAKYLPETVVVSTEEKALDIAWTTDYALATKTKKGARPVGLDTNAICFVGRFGLVFKKSNAVTQVDIIAANPPL